MHYNIKMSTANNDKRCCGSCHCLCRSKTVDENKHICTKNVIDFWNSGYIQTSCGTGSNEIKECGCNDCCATTLCLPLKITLFFPCFIGSLFNACINKVRSTDSNYLF